MQTIQNTSLLLKISFFFKLERLKILKDIFKKQGCRNVGGARGAASSKGTCNTVRTVITSNIAF